MVKNAKAMRERAKQLLKEASELEKKEKYVNFHDNKVLKFAKKYLPFTTAEHHGRFFIKENGKWHATMLFMIIILACQKQILCLYSPTNIFSLIFLTASFYFKELRNRVPIISSLF